MIARCHHVTAVDLLQEKVDLINQRKAPIKDDYIEKYLAAKEFDMQAVTDGTEAYREADFIIVAVPTNYDSVRNILKFFFFFSVEAVLEATMSVNNNSSIIKSTILVGYTEKIREKYNTDEWYHAGRDILFSPEFLRESKALYDNLYPNRIIVSCDQDSGEQAEIFAGLLQEGALKEDIDTLFMGFTEAEAVKLSPTHT